MNAKFTFYVWQDTVRHTHKAKRKIRSSGISQDTHRHEKENKKYKAIGRKRIIIALGDNNLSSFNEIK